MGRNHIHPIILALTAAILFGASAPLAKLLLGEVEPIPVAAFLYLGSRLSLIAIRTFQQSNHRLANREAQIKSILGNTLLFISMMRSLIIITTCLISITDISIQ